MQSTLPLPLLLFLHVTCGTVVGGDLSHVGCVLTAQNGTHDLFFRPQSQSNVNYQPDAGQCVTACRQASFKYAGVGMGSGCLCGNAYGSAGSSSGCAPCQHDTSPLCGTPGSLAVYAVYDETQMRAPTAPSNLRGGQHQENALQIFWNQAEGHVTGYRVSATPLYSYSREKQNSRSFEFLEPRLTSTHLVGLTPATKYQVKFVAFNEYGESPVIYAEMWTRIGTPDPPPVPKITWYEDEKMGISLSPAENTKGPVTFYRLAVIEDHQDGFFNKESDRGWKEAKELGYPYYIAAEWPANALPSSFVVGNGDKVGSFFNGPLPSSRSHWHPALVVVSNFENVTKVQYSGTDHHQHAGLSLSREKSLAGDVSHTEEEGSGVVTALWIAIAVTFLILLCCVTILLLLKFKLMPGQSSRRRPRREAHPLTNSQPSTRAVSTSSTPYNEFVDCGGYTHLAFVSEEEDSGRKAVQALTTVHNIPRSEVKLPPDESVRAIGQGRFGLVFASSRGGQPAQLFQLPSPSNKSSGWDEDMFLGLEAVLRPSTHANVASLAGFLQSETHLYLLVGGVSGVERNLKKELLHLREVPTKNSQSLILCAMGVAEGLFHLHSYKLNHGELCACAVVLPADGDWTKPKLTGFGALSCNPVNKERDTSRWMAVEQLHNRCVPPSDSWAFGVLLWEISTLGATPLADIKPEDIKKRVLNGARPPQLDNMGDNLYQLMLTCWQLSREERPDPGTLACSLHELLHTANDELGLWESFKWPPFHESLEFLPTTK